MHFPKVLWFFKPLTQEMSVVLPLFDHHGDLSRIIVICGTCAQRFSVSNVAGISFDGYGCMSSVRALLCPHCSSRMWIDAGVVTPVLEIWCPSCGLAISEKPVHAWISHDLCGWEGRLSEVLVKKPTLELTDGEPPEPELTP